MRTILLVFVFQLAFSCVGASFHCVQCTQDLAEDDKYCPNCGWEINYVIRQTPVARPATRPLKPANASASVYVSGRTKGVDETLPIGVGSLRGLCTIASTPVEYVRMLCMLEDSIPPQSDQAALEAVFWAPASTVIIGTLSAVCDTVVGALDVLTLGAVGNSVWDNPHKSAWFWRRDWKYIHNGVSGALGF